MRQTEQIVYRGYTLILFEPSNGGGQDSSYWLVIAPDGVNIVGHSVATQEDARSVVDHLPASAPHS